MKVLIADDEPRIAKSLARIIESYGYEPTLARDGLEAWELFAEDPQIWGLVITDIRMPKLDGVALVKRIRACGSDIRVVFISGHGEVPDVEGVAPAMFLAKPFRRAQLLDALNGI
ncbi:Sporulation initiation phosphotransferase F [Enhygromyxa salina]|uniref:Sporulation initiation phosphotransferase F n=1 Tax=Enhygromyxa salina TaxID=215803 RepID=A0A2S9YGJ5_9BACT|nr:response regulator [Enhygromyxa salina]PRQ04219.1 Sporulation initiation phosphotransferase F [Enhygromyxa salina]